MRKNIWIFVSIALAIIAAGVVAMSIVEHIQFRSYQEANPSEEVQQTAVAELEETVSQLTAKLELAETELEAKQANTIDAVFEDVNYFMETMYTIDKDNASTARYEKLKTYITDKLSATIQKSTAEAVTYTETIKINNRYYESLTDDTAHVLYYCTTTMQSDDLGKIAQSLLYDIDVVYDSETTHWQIDSIAVSRSVDFNSFQSTDAYD